MMNEWLDPKSPENRRNAMWLLLIGMFAMTRINIGGKLGISELVMVVSAPFIFFKNIDAFRRERIMGFLLLIFLWICGAVFSDWYNHTDVPWAMRGIAHPTMVLVNVIVLYSLLRKNPENMRFLLLGIAFSSVISIFMFQRISNDEWAMIDNSLNAITGVLHYKLFWGSLIGSWLGALLSGWYLKIPKGISLLLVFVVFVAYVLCGGRSAAASYLISFILIYIGGKNAFSMLRIRRYIIPIAVIILTAGSLFKSAYKYAAVHGLLSEMEEKKYMQQTSGGKESFLSMLMSGRSEIFIATIAALDAPLVGHGSHAIDKNNYVADFLMKYGTDTDRQLYYESALQTIHRIPFHTQIVTFWMWHGIFGLLFWSYVLYLVVKTLISRMAVYPPYFGYLAFTLPVLVWDILFSPFGLRVRECTTFVICLLVRNMANGIRYPVEMRK